MLVPPRLGTSLKTTCLRLAQTTESAICADDVVRATGCTRGSALHVLSELASEKQLWRVAHGFYATQPREDKPLDKGKPANGMCQLMRAERAHKAVELAEVEAFLSSREQWPGCTTPLPVHRAPSFAPVRRRYV